MVLVFVYAGSLFSQNNLSHTIVGNWQGDLTLPNGLKIGLIFKISEDAGILKGMLDVPAQGAKDLPVEKVELIGDSVVFNVKLINGIFSGILDKSSQSLEGKWSQNGATFDMKLARKEKITEQKRPQEPKGPFPYKAEEITYANKTAGITLAGTLTLPSGVEKAPAVILISGSGAQNRDEEIMGHKPFWVIADYLTRRGFAVLRVDDRGVGGSTGNIREATSEDFAGDVLTGIEYLKTRLEIDAGKIGLAGHSEGGLIAPIAAVKSKDVAFIVLLAGPGMVGEQIIYLQARLINKGMGMTDEQADANTKMQEAIFQVIKNETDSVAAREKLRNAYTRGNYNTLTEDQKKGLDKRIAAVNTPWFKFFLVYDPRPVLEKVTCPVLAMFGSKDLQVPADENLKAIDEALKKGGNKKYKTMKLEGMNHLFQNCQTGLIAEYGQIEETISPVALETLGNWIQETLK